METRTARIDRSGRLVVPASVRADLDLRDGDEVVFAAGEAAGEIRLMSRRQAVRQAQAIVRSAIPGQRRLVDDLLRDRRDDTAREKRGPMRRS